MDEEICIAKTEDAESADRWSLVLEAAAVPHRVVLEEEGWAIWLPASFESRAREWLDEDERERAGTTDRERLARREKETLAREWTHFRFALRSAVAFAAALLAGFSVRPEWVARWILDGAAVRAGEWWRPFTALLLHADVGHLVSNVAIGALAFGCVCGFVGPWLGFFSVVAAGAAGNMLSVLLHTDGYRSMGASTAIFGALGLLTGILTLRRRGLRASTAFAPAGVGIVLLGLFGLGDYPVDAGAHVTGFVAGALVGALIGLGPEPGRA